MNNNEQNNKSLRKPGRPNGGMSYRGNKCDVRLSAEESSMLDRLSEVNGVTRSAIVRKAIRDFYKFNTGKERFDE